MFFKLQRFLGYDCYTISKQERTVGKKKIEKLVLQNEELVMAKESLKEKEDKIQIWVKQTTSNFIIAIAKRIYQSHFFAASSVTF